MARTFVLVMAALALMVGMDASTVGVATVAAQTGPTVPPTVDLTCHGYDEGATRAYNCIPEPSQQPYMRTFVPPVGSACDAGSIAEFPAGRIVFQIRCRDGSRGQAAAWSHWGRGPASFDMPEDASARFWVHTAFSGSSVHFVVRCRAPQERVVVNELLGRSWGNSGTNGIYGMAGCREVEVDTGEQDLQWWFTQELAATASMPPRSWERVTGAGSALPAQALQDLAGAVDLERLGGPPSQWGIQPPLDANDRAALRTPDAEGISVLDLRIASRPPDDRTDALDGGGLVRGATTRTVPLTLDLTCHGYVEAAGTRAYNCIPEPSQQHHMRTFVPPVGSACDAGSIAEFPPGRIVFQIRCRAQSPDPNDVIIVSEDELGPLPLERWTHRYLENHTDSYARVQVQRVARPCPTYRPGVQTTRETLRVSIDARDRIKLDRCTQANHNVIGGNFCITCSIQRVGFEPEPAAVSVKIEPTLARVGEFTTQTYMLSAPLDRHVYVETEVTPPSGRSYHGGRRGFRPGLTEIVFTSGILTTAHVGDWSMRILEDRLPEGVVLGSPSSVEWSIVP